MTDDVIVLCEGKRDVRLVETYYELHDDTVRVDTFIGESVPHSRQKNEDSRRIRNFVEPRNPYDVLVKSEEGDETLKPLFVKLINRLVTVDPRVCLLIDLDTAPMGSHRSNYRELIADLDQRVSDNYSGNEYGIETTERLDRSSQQVATRCRLTDRTGVRGMFSILAFHTSLEDAANTAHGDENEQIETFVTSDAAAPMRAVF